MSVQDPFAASATRLNEALEDSADLFASVFCARATIRAESGSVYVFGKIGSSYGLGYVDPSGFEIPICNTAMRNRVELAHNLYALWEACDKASKGLQLMVENAATIVLAFNKDRGGTK